MNAFWGTSFSTSPHRHETLQLVFDIDKKFLLKDKSIPWTPFSSAIIKASHLHQLDSNDSIQLFIYLDNRSDYAQKLSAKYLKGKAINDLSNSEISKISTLFFKKLLVTNNCKELFEGFLKILEHLIDFEPPKEKDARIAKAIDFISDTRGKKLKVKEVADHVCLSESRLRFLFKKEVGQPIQSFMVWMKVITSLNYVLKGKPIAQSAYDVGFWDSSHMNRSYKELLGAGPGDLKKFEKELKIILCDKANFYTFKTEILKHWDSAKPFKTIEL